MPKYLSNRFKVTPQSQLNADRYRYLSIENAEPNLGDPLVGPSSIGAKPVAAGQQYIMVSVQGQTGERYWIPNQGGLIPGSISVFEENSLVGGLSSTTQLNFIGNSVTAEGIGGINPGIAVTVTIVPPGIDNEVLFKDSGDFATDSTFTFDSTENLLAAGDRITVGTGGTVITTLGIGSVGIGTTDPVSRLHVQGDLKLSGTIIDRLGNTGDVGYLLVKEADVFGGVKWSNPNAVQSGAGGTYGQIQFHGSTQLVEGAANFYYDEGNQRVGIGSTQPTQLLDVLGISTFSGGVFIDRLNVSGITTLNSLNINTQGIGEGDLGSNGGGDGIFGIYNTTNNGTVTFNVKSLGGVYNDILSLVSDTATVDGKLNVSDTTNNTLGNVNTGALQLDGGAGIAKNLTVGQTIQATNLNITGIGTIETFDFGIGEFDNITVLGISTLGNVVVNTNTISTKSGNLTLDSASNSIQIAASDTLILNNTADSSSTITGSFQVSGGAGIVGNLHVGGNIVGNVSTATNLAGGAAGSLPYQSDTGITTFLADPNQDGYVLTYNDTTEAPEWVDIATLTGVGYTLLAVDSGDNVILRLNDTTKSVNADVLITAGTNIAIDSVAAGGFTINASNSVSSADNLNGGTSGDIVYQDGENSTAFLADPGPSGNGYVLTWDNPNVKPKWSDLTTLSGAGYTFFAVDDGGNVILRLSDGSTTDDVKITAGSGISIDPVTEGGFTISGSGGGFDFDGLEVYEENSSVGTGFTALKFIGNSITASNGTGGIANITVSVNYSDISNPPTIPTNISDLTNNVGFITSGSLDGYATENYVDSAVAGVSTFSGNYNDLSNKPTIPTDTNDLTNGAGFINGITIKDEGGALSTKATTLNFVGSGVVASGIGSEKTITISDFVGWTYYASNPVSLSGNSTTISSLPNNLKAIRIIFENVGWSSGANNDLLVELASGVTWNFKTFSDFPSGSASWNGSNDGFGIYRPGSNRYYFGTIDLYRSEGSTSQSRFWVGKHQVVSTDFSTAVAYRSGAGVAYPNITGDGQPTSIVFKAHSTATFSGNSKVHLYYITD